MSKRVEQMTGLEAVMRAHCDTLLRKDGTDVSDLLERLRELTGDDDK